MRKFSTDVENLDLNKVVYLEPVFKKSTISGLQVVFTELVNKIILKDQENQEIIHRTSNLAFIDQLTGLPNRNACTEKLDTLCLTLMNKPQSFTSMSMTLSQSMIQKGISMVICSFKILPTALKSIEDDHLYVSRHQGDEFLLLYTFVDQMKVRRHHESIKEQFPNYLLRN